MWKNESQYLTICEVMTPTMWWMICNIFYRVWVVYPGNRLCLPRMLIVRCLIFFGCQTASVSLEPDENAASLKTALHDHALDSDIMVCISHSSCSESFDHAWMCIVALIKIQFPRASTCGWQILCMFRKTDLLYFVVVCRFKKIVSLIFYEKIQSHFRLWARFILIILRCLWLC